MLLSLNIKNFTLVESLEVDFHSGMTAITGETGAGKSLTLDALAMAIGDRADSDRIRHGAERAEVSALFDLNGITQAQQWLAEKDFDNDDNHCLLRRIFTREGRSKGYINGQPATMQQLQQLGEQLIDIHSQHQHQSLLRRETYRVLVDDHGGHQALAAKVAQDYRQWRDTQDRLDLLSQQSSELDARRDLLSFQVEELNTLGLAEDELEQLEKKQLLLANAEAILGDSHQLLALCSEDDSFNLLNGLNQACSLAAQIPGQSPQLQDVTDMLDSARIQVEEASASLRQHVDGIEVDPQQLAEVEQRLSDIYQLARKHRIQAEQLPQLQRQLQGELDSLCGGEQDLQQLQEQAEQQRQQYLKNARELSKKRTQAAKSLAKAINTHLPELAMPGARLSIELTPLAEAKASAHGLENIELLIASNPGQPAKPLAKVASGGELSRISLAIQVVAAQHSTTPTLVFDEVDVGIGGTTADVVGKLLRQLGQGGKNQGQVICVTHQPQVASRAHHHLQVSKSSDSQATHTELHSLAQTERIDEVARMLGGAKITQQTRTHAQEMLELAAE
ncbi:DNA repair protein RecN [Porticoccus sp. W117]|uniref:DNA repair protein RecN n=1 Tax=Porticoccus sp. W117 TaxID=3054777 RepID=UPI00259404EB|nr:DNA repair protein RecN [Porticoccus sp. W117]MDM3871324.1 DNA repair protein RecN [Porticoccus sp. W117]